MGRRRKLRLRARDFGDDPHVRRRFGEAREKDEDEPWERYYKRKRKRRKKKRR